MKEQGLENSDQPDVSVIVVNYNGKEHIEESLHSLCEHSPPDATEIWVVDNASTDGSLALVEPFAASRFGVHVLKNDINLGYAGGVNSVLSSVRGRYVAVLNQDMVVENDWLDQSVSLLDHTPAVGAVSPMIVLYSEDQRINSVGQNVHVTGLGFNRWLGRPRDDAGHEPFRVSGIHGGAFLIRRSILDRIGGWDASGFLYHEDVELSWLLHLLGYDIYCAPASVVQHKYHLTMHPEKLFLLEKNRWHMLCSNLAPATFVYLAPLLVCTEVLMWGYCLWRGSQFLRAKLRACCCTVKARRAIRERRGWIRSIRTCTDWQILRRLKWRYVWDQFVTLGKERGTDAQR